MIRKLTFYKCIHCGYILKTERGIRNHEASCKENPNALGITEALEDIRCTSTSIHEVVKRIQDYLLTLGIKIHFTSYPNNFAELVHNSHNAPKGYKHNWSRNPEVPIGYPGWTGSWRGQLEIVDKKILGIKLYNAYFSKLLRGEMKKPLVLDFFHTGSGGGGYDGDFSYSGIMFVYDFPKIHEEYLKTGGAIPELINHYDSVITTYYDKYKERKESAVNSNTTLLKMAKIEAAVTRLLKEIDVDRRTVKDNVISKFNENYNVKLPLPDSAFSISEKARSIIQETSFSAKAEPHPSLKVYTDQLDILLAKMGKLKENNPEYFL